MQSLIVTNVDRTAHLITDESPINSGISREMGAQTLLRLTRLSPLLALSIQWLVRDGEKRLERRLSTGFNLRFRVRFSFGLSMSKASKSIARVSRPGDRFHTRRSLHHGNPTAMRSHNARVGAVIHAYNSAHSWVYIAFLHAARNDSHEAARDLWFSFGSDKAQRDFAALYFRRNSMIKPPIKRALVWALNALGELSTLRNDAAHTDMIWAYDRLEPGILSRDQARKRMEDRPFEDNWRHLRGDFSALSNYIMDLAYDVLMENTWPSAKRPRLKLSRAENAKKQERNRQAKQKARRPQPQSSRG